MIQINIKNFSNIKKLLSIKTLFALMTLATLLLLMYHCPFSYILGISCPGCGMTRSFISVLMLDFNKAFYYHPLWWLILIFAFGALLEYLEVIKIALPLRTALCTIVALLLFVVYFIRLFSGSEIVNIHFEESLINSILK